jgi:hypothetical protein
MAAPYPPAYGVGPGSPYTLEQWLTKYRRLKWLAAEMAQLINDEARQMCADAGLSPDLLGIHPHNAMCGLEHGHPWPDVDYNRACICMDLLRIQFDAHHIVSDWDRAVRLDPHERWLQEQCDAEKHAETSQETAA